MWNKPGDTGPTAGALGPLIILSGPTAAGKSTVIKRLLQEIGLPQADLEKLLYGNARRILGLTNGKEHIAMTPQHPS